MEWPILPGHGNPGRDRNRDHDDDDDAVDELPVVFSRLVPLGVKPAGHPRHAPCENGQNGRNNGKVDAIQKTIEPGRGTGVCRGSLFPSIKLEDGKWREEALWGDLAVWVPGVGRSGVQNEISGVVWFDSSGADDLPS